MLAAILAAVLGATAPEGTLFTADGGRVRGTLVEAGPAGVTVRLPDGSTRRFAPSDVRKVVLADGTLWRPGDPPPASREEASTPVPAPEPAAPAAAAPASPPEAAPQAAQAPAPAAVPPALPVQEPAGSEATPAPQPATPPPPPLPSSPMLVPVERLDTVFLASGGRVRALVTEESADGVVVRLVDGRERRFAPGQVAQITYADGTASVPGAPRK
jgi:hypothetical protein